MSEAQVVNMMLHRKLESGSQYSRLIPNYLSIRHRFELPADYSNTYDTLEFMAIWTNKYASQFQKVANVLKGKNVLETVKNNYNFLYKHFQYKIDENLQQIYAPSAAWHFRKVGFDCKSFSVLAMSLLLCQNIEASFVKVKLPGSNDWSHVYVQIPYQGSYLIIDATTHDNKEVNFIEKHEFNMNNLKHIGLASPYMDTLYLNLDSPSLACPGQACSCSSVGLSSPYELPIYNGTNGLNGIDFENVTSLFNGLDCIGGSAYTDTYLKNNIKLMVSIFDNYIISINNSAVNDISTLGLNVANFKGFAQMLDAAFKKSLTAIDWNSCSRANFKSTIKVTEYYSNIGIKALDTWLNSFFQKGNGKETITFKNYKSLTTGYSTGVGFYGTSAGGAETIVVNEVNYNYSLKPVVSALPAFELTQYTLQVDSTTFNVVKYLETLANVLLYVEEVGISTGETSGENTTNPIKTNPYNSKTSEAGIGGVVVVGLGLGIAAWFFSNMKDKGSKTKN